MSDNTYHYTECGLDNIYLTGGFEIIGTEYGPATSIVKARDLHKLIALHIVNHVDEISPQEVRFLRSEMLLSQSKLSELIGVAESTMRNWESTDQDRAKITKPASRLLKSLYLEYQNENSGIRRMMDKSAEYERCNHSSSTVAFDYAETGWQEQLQGC